MKAIAIDLDDTLFSEIDHVYSGYRAVANVIAKHNDLDKEQVYDRMLYRFARNGRSGLFDYIKAHYKITTPDSESLVSIYREHAPSIKLYDGVEKALDKLRERFKLAIVTDGSVITQKNKVIALGLYKLVDEVVLCLEHNAPKPSIVSYQIAAQKLGVEVQDMIIIGDDPYSDIAAASALGISSYRVTTGKYKMVRSQENAMPSDTFDSFVSASYYILNMVK